MKTRTDRIEDARQVLRNLHWAITTIRREEQTPDAIQALAEYEAAVEVWEAKLRKLEREDRLERHAIPDEEGR